MTPEDQMRELMRRADVSDEASEREWEDFRMEAHRSLAVRRGLLVAGAVALIAVGVAAGAVLTRPDAIRDPAPIPPAATDGSPTPGSSGTPTVVIEPVFPFPSGDADPSSVVQVWFVDEQTERLSSTYRLVDDPVAIGNRAVAALLAGPSGPDVEAGVTTLVPDGTRLLGLTIENGTATVDFSSEFDDTGLGSGFEHFPLAQVVWTLTQFDTVDSVVFEVEGQRIEAYGSHGLVIDRPQKRRHYEDWAPPIVVDFPFSGQQVDSTFVVEGTANVFEATVSYRVVAKGREILAEGFTTAECGTGCRGRYAETIDVYLAEDTHAVLEVFESSAEDGSPLHMVRVPINISP